MLSKYLFFLVLLVRIFLFFIPGFYIDIGGFEGWAFKLNSLGLSNFYTNGFADYFPGYLYILWIMGGMFHFIFPSIPFASSVFEVFIKIVTTFFDIGTAFFVYKIILKHNSSLALKAAFFYFANPALIFNSSVWGQIDGIMTFFLLSSVYLLLEVKNFRKWSFFYSIAVLIKPQSLALLPLIIFKNFQLFRFFDSLKGLIFIPVFLIIISIPFFQSNLLGLFDLSLRSVNVYPYTSLFAFNFWAIVDWWKNDNTLFLIFPYKMWGLILYLFCLSLIIIPFFKKIKEINFFYIASSLFLMAFYLFPTRIHERYLFPFFAFFIIATLIKKTKESKYFFIVYLLVSMIHFLNLWYVYYYYNFIYNNSVFRDNIFYDLINQNYKFLSVLLVFCFLIILAVYYRLTFYGKKIPS